MEKDASADIKGEGSESKTDLVEGRSRGEAHDDCNICFNSTKSF